jgi:hypothetical protein
MRTGATAGRSALQRYIAALVHQWRIVTDLTLR